MSEKKLRFSIFHKVLLTMLFITLIPLFTLWYINNNTFQKNLESQISFNLKNTAHSVVQKVNGWTDMNVNLLKQNSLLENMLSMETYRQQPIVDSIKSTYDWTYLVYAIGQDGYKTVRSDDLPIVKSDGTKAHFRGERGYFKDIMAGNPMSQQVVLSKTLGRPVFILCTRLMDDLQINRGALCMGMTLVDMSNEVTDVKIGKTGYAILLDRKGKAIAHGDSKQVDKVLQDLSKHPAITQENLGKEIRYNKDGILKVAYSEKTNQGWTVIVEMDYQDGFSELTIARNHGLILLAVVIVLVIVAAMIFAGRLTKPIRNLTAAADVLSRGTEEIALKEATRSDEIGDMARAIERMGNSIKIAISRLSKK